MKGQEWKREWERGMVRKEDREREYERKWKGVKEREREGNKRNRKEYKSTFRCIEWSTFLLDLLETAIHVFFTESAWNYFKVYNEYGKSIKNYKWLFFNIFFCINKNKKPTNCMFAPNYNNYTNNISKMIWRQYQLAKKGNY